MTEVLFYHLEHRPWDQILPRQLATALERGWRCVVQVGAADRLDAVSEVLWKTDADVFLPHGSAADGFAERQPIWLTAGDDNPNHATVRFFIEAAPLGELAGLQRAVVLFDGRDEQAVARAREQWKAAKAAGHDISYWQQDENLRWHNKSKAAASA
jgi:DNA polymerase-3 subunit chi